MRNRPFRLKLFDARKLLKSANGAESMRFQDLETVVYTGPDRADRFDLIGSTIGPEINYGTLTAYLLRRFGYPNSGWDDYKELACYQLSTPVPDMYMRVVPYVGDSSGISIMFMIASESARVIDDYEAKPREAHSNRMRVWLESVIGLPGRTDDCLEMVRRDWGSIASVDSFHASLTYLDMYDPEPVTGSGSGMDRKSRRQAPGEWLEWAEQKVAEFEAFDPRPKAFLRSRTVEDWPDEDPLKAYALAAIAALRDLNTAVRVRDSAINAFGRVDDARVILKEPAVAGYPSGAIGNAAPVEFAELHGLIMRLGNGDAKRGIAKALKALQHGAN